MTTTHIIFLSSDETFVLEPLMKFASIAHYPGYRHKSTFHCPDFLALVNQCLVSTQPIAGHLFDLLFDNRLDLAISSEKPLRLSRAKRLETFGKSGLILLKITSGKNRFYITNLLAGKKGGFQKRGLDYQDEDDIKYLTAQITYFL